MVKIKYLKPITAVVISMLLLSCGEDDFKVIPEAYVQPTIKSITPNPSDVGKVVTISGTNFSSVRGNNKISINGVPAIVEFATATELNVEVPEGATTGPVTLRLVDFLVEGPVLNIVAAPKITGLSTFIGKVGDQVIVEGQNFSDVISENTVTIDGLPATVTAASTDALTVIVPDNATTGLITVTVFGQTDEFDDGPFVVAPRITSLSVLTAEQGEEITIEGFNFSADPSKNLVTISGGIADVTSATINTITAIVPFDAIDPGAVTVRVEGQTATSTETFTPIVVGILIEVPINAIEDDVEEAADGRMTLTSVDLELGEFDTFSTPDLGLQKIGLRFNGINIPAGSTIIDASVQFVADQTPGAEPTEMTIYGENIGNAPVYTQTNGNLSSRALTTASSVWNIPPWSGTEIGPDQRTPDIANIIQEIVSRGDWASGNSINIMLLPTGVSAGATRNDQGREAEAYKTSSPEEGARLIIRYR